MPPDLRTLLARRNRPGDAAGADGREPATMPDFIVGSPPHAGGDWWYRLLLRHPSLEPAATESSAGPFAAYRLAPLEATHRGPTSPGGARLRGAYWPAATADYWVPPRLAADHTVRLVLLLRDPLERHAAALAAATASRAMLDRRRADDLFHDGLYAPLLARLRSVVPAERVLVLQLEACRTRLATEYARTLDFLGVDRSAADPEDALPASAPTAPAEPGLREPHRSWVLDEYRMDVVRLRPLAPDLDVTLWPSFGDQSSPEQSW